MPSCCLRAVLSLCCFNRLAVPARRARVLPISHRRYACCSTHPLFPPAAYRPDFFSWEKVFIILSENNVREKVITWSQVCAKGSFSTKGIPHQIARKRLRKATRGIASERANKQRKEHTSSARYYTSTYPRPPAIWRVFSSRKSMALFPVIAPLSATHTRWAVARCTTKWFSKSPRPSNL